MTRAYAQTIMHLILIPCAGQNASDPAARRNVLKAIFGLYWEIR